MIVELFSNISCITEEGDWCQIYHVVYSECTPWRVQARAASQPGR